MLNRVNAFLEAIDKKTEEMADAAEESDIARAIEQQRQQQQQQQYRLHSTATSSHHNGSSAPHPIVTDVRSTSSTASAGGGGVSAASASLPPRNPSATTPTGNRGAGLNSGSSSSAGAVPPPTPSTSASLRTSAQSQGSTTTTTTNNKATTVAAGAADAYAGVHLVPLSLPTKLPSFRPSLAEMDDHAERFEVGLSSAAGDGGGNGSDEAAAHAYLLSADPAATSSSLARLQSRCASLDAEKARWQQEAATHKAQCSAARDSLWKAEQEARSCRTAQRDAERALAAYKETAQRLLDEAQQEVRRAHEVAAAGTADAATSSSSCLSAAQREELAHAHEVHQRLELLQAEHTALLSEVDRCHEETAKAAAELQRVQDTCRQSETQADELRLAVQAAHESLEGEVAAHADTKNALRALQAQREQQQQPLRQSSQGGLASDAAEADESGEGGAHHADVAQLQRELREAKQRHQLLLLQLSNKQTVLDSAEREAADVKARYNELARQFDDAQVEVAAGFRPPGLPPSEYGLVAAGGDGGGSHRARGVVAGGALSAAIDEAGGAGSGRGSNSSQDALKRSPAMVRLVRHHGAAGRVAVSVLSAVDDAALRLGRTLTHSRWMSRVLLMGYIALLQLWVLLLVLANMISEERERRSISQTEPTTRVPGFT
ncbi:hypothetical protein ABB37_06428 [Leptomonas pyrrhocoris]|uniref:Uncharacterized protein n=1 Tax=Leptomonas pyrrhocoris TaxID=157538 RepID=A0A0M9FXT1_LEPPY|nr:hypothetical protein ABB37_06428 [Leptomonas pyrrhocoris]KPA78285.1 hypothetical protein ABB37_06428 [Leptomonas pyrrhocoris]|eukprot:XP_015656724.1 hypothetical protein ABB37_06428 [Leptomonas pyrrhocoris]